MDKLPFLQRVEKRTDRTHYDVAVVGSGMGSLTAACLLANEGLSVLMLEQNYLPGGCTSSYWRKGYIFEAGATTLVGLDEYMPLRFLLDKTGISIHDPASLLEETHQLPTLNAQPLPMPMQVYLKNGAVLHKHKDLNAWIDEAERVFGKKNQRPFWEFCYRVARFVWQTSLRQTTFPPTRFADVLQCALHADFSQLRYAGYSLLSTEWLLKKYDLHENELFREYVNEQLIITAQNHAQEVNVLFGATALCYTQFGNYYVPGGLINLVTPLLDFLENQHGELHLRETATAVQRSDNQYTIQTNRQSYTAEFVISGIPINNTLPLFGVGLAGRFEKKILPSESLNSAFQMGIAFRKTQRFNCLHHQLHLPEPLPLIGSHSIFLSLSHPDDTLRCNPDEVVASVSTHVHHPAQHFAFDRQVLEEIILNELERQGFFKREDVLYVHASHPKAWEKWTKRSWGFVGGYPQFMHTKPWQMLDARLDDHKAYLCGDTAYPGQGIPGAALSGIIAWQKLKNDWKNTSKD